MFLFFFVFFLSLSLPIGLLGVTQAARESASVNQHLLVPNLPFIRHPCWEDIQQIACIYLHLLSLLPSSFCSFSLSLSFLGLLGGCSGYLTQAAPESVSLHRFLLDLNLPFIRHPCSQAIRQTACFYLHLLSLSLSLLPSSSCSFSFSVSFWGLLGGYVGV